MRPTLKGRSEAETCASSSSDSPYMSFSSTLPVCDRSVVLSLSLSLSLSVVLSVSLSLSLSLSLPPPPLSSIVLYIGICQDWS